MTWHDLAALAADVGGWVIAVSVAVVAFWKRWPLRIWRGFRAFVKAMGAFVSIVDTLVALPADIAFVKHELQANSGKSVKDIATRTEQTVDDLLVQVAHVRRQNAALKTSVAKTNRRLTEHITAGD